MSETLRLTLSGTTSGTWERSVKRALLDLEGVKGVTTSSQTNLVGVAFDVSTITAERIRERIESMGYVVTRSG